MERQAWGSLAAFAVVAEERSFTRASARLGVSASALSHTMRRLEEKLGVQLLARTRAACRQHKRVNGSLRD